MGNGCRPIRRGGPGPERLRALGRNRLPDLRDRQAGTRGRDGILAQLDLTPLGRNEGDTPVRWLRRHDEYEDAPPRGR